MYQQPIPEIVGWMEPVELQWLYENAQRHQRIVEVGSWRGRSTHALLCGCTGAVTAVDWFKGDEKYNDGDMSFVRDHDLFEEFKKNVGGFPNLVVLPMTSLDAADYLFGYGEKFDMIFLDAAHGHDDVLADLYRWTPLLEEGGLLCGHDYGFDGVASATTEFFGQPATVVCHSIWVKP